MGDANDRLRWISAITDAQVIVDVSTELVTRQKGGLAESFELNYSAADAICGDVGKRHSWPLSN